MKTHLKKITLLSTCLLTFATSSPLLTAVVSADTIQTTENVSIPFSAQELDIITNNGQYEYDTEMVDTAVKLQDYFTYDQYGTIILNATKEELMTNLGITEEQAQDLLAISDLHARKTSYRGFVGVYLNLGPKVRSMGGWAAGTFAGGYVGWYAKQLAALGPWGAGAAALVTASTVLTVKWAVENHVRVVPIGQNIPGFNASYNVYIP